MFQMVSYYSMQLITSAKQKSQMLKSCFLAHASFNAIKSEIKSKAKKFQLTATHSLYEMIIVLINNLDLRNNA